MAAPTSLWPVGQTTRPKIDKQSAAILAQEVTAAFSELCGTPDKQAGFPSDCLSALHTAGLCSLTVSHTYGGHGAGLAVATEVIRTVARNHASAALILAEHYICTATLHEMGWPEPVLREVLRPVALEGALLGMPRIEAGPDISGFVMSNTLAQLTTDGWCLSGRKSYAIGAAGLTFALVRACTDESPPRDGFFIVPLATPGVSIDPSRDGLGVQVIGSYDLVFNNVLIPPHHALLVAPASCSEAGSTQIWLAVLLGAIYAGTTEAARDWIARLLNEPAPSNPNILLSTIPRLQSELEEIEARMMMNRRLLASIAHDHDEGVTISAQDASFVKHTVTENAITTIDHALKLCGCRGISRHSQLESYFSDVLRTRSHAQPAMTHTAAGLSATKTARRAKTGARSGT